MKPSLEQFGRQVMSGADMSLGGMALRVGLAAVEPFYAALITGRNLLYDSGLFPTHRLPRPVISVGNITAGGTGKTPVVRWLAGSLRRHGLRPAVLLRGYKIGSGVTSDEQVMLDHHLNNGRLPPVPVLTNPSRLLAGQRLLQEHAAVTHFILDDGFQHRQLHRDFDLVLINAADPFGYGHVHPRGLLREPLRGLGRADALLITRADLVEPLRLREIERRLRRQNRRAPIYRANHAHTGLRSPGCAPTDDPDRQLEALRHRPFFAFGGIGNPASLQRQLQALGGDLVGCRWLPDHHEYTETEVAGLKQQAKQLGAEVLVTTEKDWVKIRGFSAAHEGRPVWRIELSIRFWGDNGQRLLEQALGAVTGGGVA